ncbi:hypothetical protein IVA98_30425 [Bradyrhizobium sp. 160]|uniref:hypothetical protein n=1 Tax=Bradyrhizobium sp. 160 TaxID=2782634 RepID=UPI001FF7AC1F|nr:hypothetical protein [Bradyrhizobium sp. 160]MCK1627360.1 hypothetical protein [Bradyrhizobium sp. 160]
MSHPKALMVRTATTSGTSLMRMPKTSVGQRHLTQLLIGEADEVSFNNAAAGADQQGLRPPNALVPNAPIRRPAIRSTSSDLIIGTGVHGIWGNHFSKALAPVKPQQGAQPDPTKRSRLKMTEHSRFVIIR